MLVPFMGTEVTRLLDWEQQQQRHDWKLEKKINTKSINSMQVSNSIFHSEMNRQFYLKGVIAVLGQFFLSQDTNSSCD